jgi:DNA-binding response OmpR family regulator
MDSSLPAAISSEGRLKGRRVLLIEDAADIRILYLRSMQRAGALVFAVSSTEDAWNALEEFRPNLIVCDIGLPDENGISFIRRLRQQEARSEKRIYSLAMTAFHDFYYDARRAGFDDCVEKPLNGEQLVTKLSRASGERK